VAETSPEHEAWQYLGVGCVTAVAGLVGGGMIAVLIAKIAGAIQKCPADATTGAPCNWTGYWAWGAIIGLIVLPSVALWRLRRGRQRAANSNRG
jgi:hypothetical protein